METSTLAPPKILTIVFVIHGLEGKPAQDAEVHIESRTPGIREVRGRSDARGEFSWRPPIAPEGAGPVQFRVTVQQRGFLRVTGEFTLSPFGTPIESALRFEILENVARIFLALVYDPPRMAQAPPPSFELPPAPTAARPSSAAEEPRVLRQPKAGDDLRRAYATVQVFYATDRKAHAGASPNSFFGKERNADGSLQYGICEVSIPRDHRMAHMERPSYLRLEFHENPAKHVMLLAVGPRSRERFFVDLAHTVGESKEKSVFVYIHGFNVDFGDATRRAAQLAYDLGFDGAPVVYSWPSKGEVNPLAYTADEASVQWTTPHLKQFLEELAQKSKATTIHLIAHSMGNRALTDALQLLFAENHSAPPKLFHQVVLTAPDIDIGVFRQLAAAIQGCSQRVTLYASSEDLALEVSRRVHGVQRAGDSDPEVVIVPGIDTVDVSAVDTSFLGHSYFGENRSVVADLFNLLRNGLTPDRRPGLRPKSKNAGTYWIFQS